MSSPPIVIVSGGSETITSTLLQWARECSIAVHIFAITVPSLFRRQTLGVQAVECDATSLDDAKVQLIRYIEALLDRFGSPLFAFPTDDDSLELLLRAKDELGDAIKVSRAKALPLGGLSKAELFDSLAASGLEDDIAPTIVVRCERDLVDAKQRWGEALILKPDRKPWKGSIPGGAKVLSSRVDLAAHDALVRKDLDDGRPWIAQQKLGLLNDAERSACCVYSQGFFCYAEVAELMKYPARGGSAIWVTTNPGSSQLRSVAERILLAIEAEGVFEMSFLADDAGRPRLIELNPRPWLQVELLQAAGVDVFAATIAALNGGDAVHPMVEPKKRDWVSIERFLLKVIEGESPGRVKSLRALLQAMARFPIVSMWTNVDAPIRARWVCSLAAKVLGRLRAGMS